MVGDQIQVSMTAAEPGSCQCIPAQTTTNQTILVTPMAVGTYEVTAVVNGCGEQTVVGATSVVVSTCTPNFHTLCLNQGRLMMNSYSNALGSAFQPIQDSSAFACP